MFASIFNQQTQRGLVLRYHISQPLPMDINFESIARSMIMPFGLIPILWSTGTGADVMKRIAAPMVGGMISATILTLLLIPAIYSLFRGWGLRNES